MNNLKKISLFIMGIKGYHVLLFIVANYKHLLSNVIIARDPAIAEDYYEKITELCEKEDIPYFQKSARVELGSYSLAISWKWLIHNNNSKLIVLHDSLLPEYRGFNPLVSMLINGEKKIGVTSLFANEKFDRGDIIAISSSMITYPIKIKDAIEIVLNNYVDLIDRLCKQIDENKIISGSKQDHARATYSLWRDEDDYIIDWSQDALRIKRFIDAVGFPYKNAKTIMNGSIVRIIDSIVVNDVIIENRKNGKVIFIEDGLPVIVCARGLLKITNMIAENGKSLLPFSKMRTRFGS
jgi:methionyl-tRNA formyltransferase